MIVLTNYKTQKYLHSRRKLSNWLRHCLQNCQLIENHFLTKMLSFVPLPEPTAQGDVQAVSPVRGLLILLSVTELQCHCCWALGML